MAAGMVFITCALAGHPPFRTGTWDSGDAGLYLDMARHGFNLVPCDGAPWLWCGNTGWFPGYPWLIRGISGLGLPVAPVALALTWSFALLTLVLVWVTFLERRTGAMAALVLVYAAWAPGHIWSYAMFPLSLLAFSTVAYLWLLSRERWVVSGLVGAGLVLVYPVGIAAPAAAALWIVFVHRDVPLAERARRVTLAVGPAMLSIGLLLLLLQMAVGHWDAYFLVQANYKHDLRNPLGPTWHAISTLFGSAPFSLQNMANLQTLLVSLSLACVLADVARRRERAGWETLVLFWALAAWFIPAATTNQSISRGEAVLLPLALLVGRLPRALAVILVAAAVALSIPFEVAYFRDLIP